ncbi:MAG: UDP-N-acetylmuramoyl-tripeptide--D-alanyl-D-alanine ligase [Nocardioidaceae bacterium]
MKAMTLGQIAAAVGGEVVGAAAHHLVDGHPFVDSRAPVPGGLFVAVPGERVDGHDFAAAAVSAGAAAVLTTRRTGGAAVVVANPVEALGKLARHVLEGLPDLTVIAITGSQGKTGTKDMLAQLLESVDETVSTVGNLNNEIGVPLTALRATGSTRFLVVEMGARARGEIAYLCSIVRPVVGVVLNVGTAHVSEFGSQLDIAEAKGELVEALPADGVAVLNLDDPLVRVMRRRSDAPVLTFGESADAGIRWSGVHLTEDGRCSLTLAQGEASHRLTLRSVGEQQAPNAAAAAGAALAVGMPFKRVTERLAEVRTRSRWRMEVHTSAGGVTVVNDAYNANPASMGAALETLAQIGHRRDRVLRTIAVLGEMRELGDISSTEHGAIGRLAARLGVDKLVVVGAAARPIHLAAGLEDAWKGESVCVPDPAAAVALLRATVRSGDVVLVKASRAAGLEIVAEALLAGVPDDTVAKDEA